MTARQLIVALNFCNNFSKVTFTVDGVVMELKELIRPNHGQSVEFQLATPSQETPITEKQNDRN